MTGRSLPAFVLQHDGAPEGARDVEQEEREMMKKMAAWIGMALMAGALAVACGSKAKPAEVTPPPATAPAAGDTYGAPTTPPAETPPAEAPAATP